MLCEIPDISRSSGRVTVEATVGIPTFKPCKPVRSVAAHC